MTSIVNGVSGDATRTSDATCEAVCEAQTFRVQCGFSDCESSRAGFNGHLNNYGKTESMASKVYTLADVTVRVLQPIENVAVMKPSTGGRGVVASSVVTGEAVAGSE